MAKQPNLKKKDLEMLSRKPYNSSTEISSSSKWPALIGSTLCFAGVNSLVVWVFVTYGHGYGVLALLGAMVFMNSICDLDELKLLNNRRFRSNMNGNMVAYVLVWLFLLLFPAIATVQGISLHTSRAIALCLAPLPTVVGFITSLLSEKKNVWHTTYAFTHLKESQARTQRS